MTIMITVWAAKSVFISNSLQWGGKTPTVPIPGVILMLILEIGQRAFMYIVKGCLILGSLFCRQNLTSNPSER